MKNYKLSEIKDICKMHQEKDMGCYKCKMMEVCRMFYLTIPYRIKFDGEDDEELQRERD